MATSTAIRPQMDVNDRQEHMTDEEDPNPHITNLEERVGLPMGFLDELLIEGDWSFVIKSHAFVEATVATFLTEATDARLENVFSFLQLGGGRTSKLAFAAALDLFEPSCLRFARSLSTLRNELVHKVKNVNFTFEEHLQELDTSDRRNILRDFTAPFPEFEDFLAANGCVQFQRRAKLVAHFSVVALVSDGHYRLHPEEGNAEFERAMLSGVLGALLRDIADEERRLYG
jgi:hypothetical protein